MSLIFCPKEIAPGETRVAMTPESAARLAARGLECAVESGAGEASGFLDAEYDAAGARVVNNRSQGLAAADVVVGVNPLGLHEIPVMKQGATTIGFLDPYRMGDIVRVLARAGLRAVSLDLVPRTTLAQKMDALSSQAGLAGYVAVVLAAWRLDKALPLMMTPAGTLQAAKFLILGAGVAGLQAIATAKRLGARVTGFDPRPAVEEQVKSLGAKFLKIDLGQTGQTEQGYAKELTEEQLARQREAVALACVESDVVITTAQVFGRPAPRLVTSEILGGMRRGSVVVDLAVATGGNVEGSKADNEVILGQGVKVLGSSTLARYVPRHASQAYASNVANYILHFADGGLDFDRDDEIGRGAVLTRGGRIVQERFQNLEEE